MLSNVSLRTAATAVLMVLPLLALTAPAEAAGCTVVGTSGNDRLVGTAGADTICGLGGRDVLVGRGGDDIFRDGGGNDVVYGGGGNDLSVGQPGRDTYYGEDGTDRMFYLDYTQPVRVTLNGVADDGASGELDNVQPDVENLTGTERSDVLIGSAVSNRLDGTWGDDVLRGGEGDDVLLGASDFDSLYGEGGNDVLDGGTYNDLLVGGGGADTIDGRGTMSPYDNVCDRDPADSVTRCTTDAEPPSSVVPTNTQQLVEQGRRLSYKLHAEDVAGTARVEVRFTRASDGAVLDFCPATMTRLMEEPYRTDSDWRWGCDIPADAALGAYVLEARLVDRLGNAAGFGSTAAQSTRVDVAVVSSEPDTTPPAVSEAVVSTSAPLAPGEAFTVTARLQDASGVEGAFVYAVNPAMHTLSDVCQQGVLTSGHRLDGTWTFECQVPLRTRSGVHDISIRAADRVDNATQYPYPVVATYEVMGGDDSGPDIVSLTAAPSIVAPGESFTVEAVVTDPTGVDEWDVQIGFYGAPSVPAPWNGFSCSGGTRVTGTSTDGTWRFDCTVPLSGTQPGDWLIVGYARDKLGTYTNVSANGSSDDTRGSLTITSG